MKFIKASVKSKILSGIPVHLDRQGAFHMAWGHIYNNHMRGDYVEFGVYRGDSLRLSYLELQKFARWNASQINSDENWRRQIASEYLDYLPNFIGFDTFEGMPKNSENAREYASGNFETSLERVKHNLQGYIPPPTTKTHRR